MKQRILWYCIKGLGYCAWLPEDGKGLPSLWFGSLKEVREFAIENGFVPRQTC